MTFSQCEIKQIDGGGWVLIYPCPSQFAYYRMFFLGKTRLAAYVALLNVDLPNLLAEAVAENRSLELEEMGI
jgi:hypothetical protein